MVSFCEKCQLRLSWLETWDRSALSDLYTLNVISSSLASPAKLNHHKDMEVDWEILWRNPSGLGWGTYRTMLKAIFERLCALSAM